MSDMRVEQLKQNAELKVFITTTDAACDDCGEQLGRKAWVTTGQKQGSLVAGLR